MQLRPYSVNPPRLALQVVVDVLVLVWLYLWYRVGVAIHDAVISAASVGYRIQNSAVRRGLLARVLGYGDVEVESAGRDGAERLAHIAHAEEFANELLMAVEARRTGRPYPSPDAASGAAPSGYAPPGSSWGDGGPESYSPPLGYRHPRDRDGL